MIRSIIYYLHRNFIPIAKHTLGIIITIVLFFLTVLNEDGINIKDPIVIAFGSLLFGLLVDRITSTINYIEENETIIRNYRGIVDSISNSFSAERIVGQKNIDDMIIKKLATASFVKNTFIGSKSSVYASSYTGSAVFKSYEVFFKNSGGVWIDIIGVPELYSGRYEEINIKNDVKHYVIIKRDVSPTMNFIIIEYEGESPEEVLFGWTYSEISSDNYIFKSSDQKIVSFFKDYFNVMQEGRIDEFKIDYTVEDRKDRVKKHSSIVDRKGCWITIGYEGKEVKSVACFDIDFVGGKPKIIGMVVWKNRFPEKEKKYGFEKVNHDSNYMSYNDRKIYLEYINPVSSRKGICVYNFIKTGNLERINGYLHDSDKDSRVQIEGVKIEDNINSDWKGFLTKIEENKSKLDQIAKNENLHIDWGSFGPDFGDEEDLKS